jgi:ATP phosphoribosyltransferase
MPHLEVWFQRGADVVRKVRDGDIDFGIIGYDNVAEYQGETDSVVIIHEQLGYGYCYLAVSVPEDWTEVSSVDDLHQVASTKSDSRPLRIVTKFHRQATAFLDKHNIKPYRLLYADGALEASPLMGTADFIVDLVSTGVTLRENRLKQIEGGLILNSQSVFIGNRTALTERPEVLETARTMLERFEAHLRAIEHHNIVANIRGDSPEQVAQKIFSQPDLGGLQGPTISSVYLRESTDMNWYAVGIVVHKNKLDEAIQQLRQIGGSGVLVLPITYIFDEEPPRWRGLLEKLNLATSH